MQESGLELDEEAKLPFLEMHDIVEGLKQKNLAPALRQVFVLKNLSCHNT